VLVVVQAAGVPCVISDIVAQEASVVPGLVQRLPLDSSPGEWALVVLDEARQHLPVSRGEALGIVGAGLSSIVFSARQLQEVYLDDPL
jgi:hypothetical protein